jgi:tetratricopeptide (TPR) repeat protein
MNRTLFVAMTGLLCLPWTNPATAQIYEDPSNLKVLPPDISANDLRDTMKGFSLGVGLRCSDCHVGEEGEPLTDYAFSSDEKELKRTARLMLKMTNTLNQELLASLGDDRVEVQCVTCHRGLRLPRTTAEVLTIAAENGGVEELKSTYGELREQYYGTHSYDFSVFQLGEFVRSRAAAGKPREALAMLDILSAENPQSYWLEYLYGETYEREDNVDEALSHYRKAIELSPDDTAWIRGHVEQLAASSEQ